MRAARYVQQLMYPSTRWTAFEQMLASVGVTYPSLRNELVSQVWMRAVVSHGPEGKVLATARALFVAPKPSRLLREGIRTLFPSWQFGRKE